MCLDPFAALAIVSIGHSITKKNVRNYQNRLRLVIGRMHVLRQRDGKAQRHCAAHVSVVRKKMFGWTVASNFHRLQVPMQSLALK